jgi:dihydrofolate reductase/thymidylate synthase
MKLNLILNRDENDIIGINGELLYHIRDDLEWFKKHTVENIIVMGYKTWMSLPKRPLNKRYNIVISNHHYDELRSGDNKPNQVFRSYADFYHNIFVEDSMDLYPDILQQMKSSEKTSSEKTCLSGDPSIFIIGGASLYEEAMKYHVDAIYETKCISNSTFDQYEQIKKCSIKIDPREFCETYTKPMKGIASYYFKCTDLPPIRIKKEINYTFSIYRKNTQVNLDESSYLRLLNDLYSHGLRRQTRNSEVISSFSEKMTFDLRNGFPLLTSKKMGWKTILRELLWFIRGSTDNTELQEQNVHIWDGNASKGYLQSRGLDYEEGDLGPIYGHQWRNFGGEYRGISGEHGKGVDQIEYMIDLIKNDPSSRRIIMSAWNPPDLEKMALPPCHILFQIYVDGDFIDGQLYQRSGDMFLGVPFNIASYAFFLHIIGQITHKKPRFLYHILGDTHIYSQHYHAVEQQLMNPTYPFPTVTLSDQLTDINHIEESYFKIENYQSCPAIKAPMVV